MNLKALWSAVAIGVICAAAMVTLVTWPPYRGSSWELAYPPAWWQLDWLGVIGIFLSALPSLAVFHLNDFFASAEHLRNPFVTLLITLEVFLLCLLTYGAVAYGSKAAARAKSATSEKPD